MISVHNYLGEKEENGLFIYRIKLQKEKKVLQIYMSQKKLQTPATLIKIESQIRNYIPEISSISFFYSVESQFTEEHKLKILENSFNVFPNFKKYAVGQMKKDTENDLFHISLNQSEIPNYQNDFSYLSSELERFYGCAFPIEAEFQSESSDLEEYVKVREEEQAQACPSVLIERKEIDKKELSKRLENDGESWGRCNLSIPQKTISEIYGNKEEAVMICAEISKIDMRDIGNGKIIFTMDVTDRIDGISVKIFIKEKEKQEFFGNLKIGQWISIFGKVEFDTYVKADVLSAKGIKKIQLLQREDHAEDKRIELHLHTPMSDMDGVSSTKELIATAARWGHTAIGITDHGVVQAFPEAMEAGKKHNLKILYGMEGYLFEEPKIVFGQSGASLKDKYVVFDIETTGFSPYHCKIIEIGAVKIENGQIIDRFHQLINPEETLSYEISELTHITDDMLKDQPKIQDVIPLFCEFCKDSVLVAHNAPFDMSFIKRELPMLDNTVLDTLNLSRILVTEIKRHKLNLVCKFFNINLENHHRAVDDAEATAMILLKLFERLEKKNISKLSQINDLMGHDFKMRYGDTYHIILYAQNDNGIKNLYRIVSESHINYFYKKPQIPKQLLDKYREGILIGSACEAGEVFKAVLKRYDEKKLFDIAKKYDYLEIQPIANNMHLVRNKMVQRKEDLEDINKTIYALGKKTGKLVVATGDVHFLNPEDEAYRRILMAGKGFDDADEQAPLYFKTTEEMYKDFSYFSEDVRKELIIENPRQIADRIDSIKPIPDETFPPKIEGAEEELRRICIENAKKMYGENIPDEVSSRLERELQSIIGNGYAVLYIIAQKLVQKSMDDGYLVGSRGSVGSSFAATMSGITEVNPLQPHYLCSNCYYTEFIKDGSVGSGVDMKDKECPGCKSPLTKQGFDIPFEVFLGFEGDKEPDIDLNFASEEQSVAHKYTEELFGEGYVFRAGTIGTIAEKTAFGFVKKYFEEKGISKHPAEIQRLTLGCSGVKRTTGQHPGGVMVVPSDKDIHDFSPIQYPANDSSSGVKTTHFDYHSISGRILKLDILGHDTPTIIRMLEDFTKTNAQEVPLDDPKTMSIFLSTDAIGVTAEELGVEVGTLGIPEFGTPFVRQMLLDTKPTTFSELVRISGLSHGTDVWVNNAQDLVRDGVATLKEVISTRDDIMTYLIYAGLEKKMSFTIMESVRKGKGIKEEHEAAMLANNVPKWYIKSCKTIKYMFPKAHAVAYVTMSFRIAYYKVHYPEAFYATYFTMKATDFDADLICKGRERVLEKLEELNNMGNSKTAKDKNLITVLEVANEMFLRNVKLLKVDLYRSHSKHFLLEGNDIRPPFIALQGIGESVAENIMEQRVSGEFISIEDLILRTKANKTCIETLKEHGCLKGLSETNQLNLFDF